MTTTSQAGSRTTQDLQAGTPATGGAGRGRERRRTMRAGSVVSEAWRDVLTGTTRVATFSLVLLIAVGALAAVDVRAVVGIVAGAQDFRDAGASIQVLDAPGQIDAARCEALTGIAGVRAAGAVRAGASLRALNLPASDLSAFEVTPGLPRVLDPTATAGSGVWLAAEVADTLGAHPGNRIALGPGTRPGGDDADPATTPTAVGGTATVAGVYPYPDDGRARTLGYAVLTPVPATGTFDACWAEIWPVNETTATYLRMALLPDPTGQAQATQGQLNSRLGAGYDAPALLTARLTRPAPIAALAIGLALGYAAIRARRLEFAAALHARVPRPALAWQVLLETAAWTSAATVIAATALWWVAAAGNPEPGIETWATGMRTLLTGAIGTLLGSQVAAVTTREKHLFRYFKDR